MTKAVRGGVVAISRGPSPSSSQRRSAAGFVREHGVGAGLDREAVDVFGADQPAEARRRLEQDERDAPRATSSNAAARPADAAADDDITLRQC